jgi:hypothetical protein
MANKSKITLDRILNYLLEIIMAELMIVFDWQLLDQFGPQFQQYLLP